MMYRQVYFVLFVCLTGVFCDDFDKCMELIDMDSERRNEDVTCCRLQPINSGYTPKENNDTRYEECEQLPGDTACSEKGICSAKKLGIVNENGEIDKAELKKFMEEEVKSFLISEVYDSVMEYCINGDLSKYQDDDSCYMEGLQNCWEVHVLLGCVEWSDENSCIDMMNTASECGKIFS